MTLAASFLRSGAVFSGQIAVVIDVHPGKAFGGAGLSLGDGDGFTTLTHAAFAPLAPHAAASATRVGRVMGSTTHSFATASTTATPAALTIATGCRSCLKLGAADGTVAVGVEPGKALGHVLGPAGLSGSAALFGGHSAIAIAIGATQTLDGLGCELGLADAAIIVSVGGLQTRGTIVATGLGRSLLSRGSARSSGQDNGGNATDQSHSGHGSSFINRGPTGEPVQTVLHKTDGGQDSVATGGNWSSNTRRAV